MRRRVLGPVACLASLLALSGCGGGPSTQELCLAVVAALPPVHLITLCLLWALEHVRRLPDQAEGASRRQALVSTGALVVLSALVMAIGGRPDGGTVVIAIIAFGALASFVSLAVWRLRQKAAYASRILVAALAGSALGVPAMVLWPKRLDSIAETYTGWLVAGSLLFAIYAAPPLTLGLFIEALVRRKGASRGA